MLLSLSTLTVQFDGDGSGVPVFLFCLLSLHSLAKGGKASQFTPADGLQQLSLFIFVRVCVLPPI